MRFFSNHLLLFTNQLTKVYKMINLFQKFALTLLFFLSLAVVSAQTTLSANSQKKENMWQDIDEEQIPKKGSRYIQPTKYRTIQLNIQGIKRIFDQAPMQYTPIATTSQTLLDLPMPDGSMETFNIVESPIMEAELSQQFPEIMTYSGVSLKNPGRFVRFDLTPAGFHAMILTVGEGTIYIDPYSFGGGDVQNYISYYKKDFTPIAGKEMVCGVVGQAVNTADFRPENAENRFESCELRTYRLALAATGEYTQFNGGTVAGALAAQVTTMNRVNAVYNREVGIQMNIIGNNNLIIYTDSDTDPYTNNDGFEMLDENQVNIDAVIGTENYDIGHVFSTGGGGVAQLYSPCSFGKARGVTGGGNPVGDPFDIDYVSHEIGHQFGGNHTQNNDCQRNTLVTSVEPGSASTIMGYAGICPPNIQSNSDDHFHGITIAEIRNFVTWEGHTCPVVTTIPNTAPTITETSGNITVPANTPFSLSVTGTDPDENDVLSYCWEQMDADPSPQPPSENSTVGPNFRSFSPSISPTRYFPNLNDIIANNTPTWEVLSSVSRTMNFRVTVRDNNTDGGAACTDFDDVIVTIGGNSGPFLVINPTATEITWAGLSTKTVSWDVAGTDQAPVSCANVDILLSSDGGLTYPTVLASNTPNDGSQAITVPNTATITARVMVVCSGDTFFDISNNNFTITVATSDYSISATNANTSVCSQTNATYTINIGSISGYEDSVDLSIMGVPAGATSSFSPSSVTPAGTSVLTISNTGAATAGSYDLTVKANSTSGTKTLPLSVTINELDDATFNFSGGAYCTTDSDPTPTITGLAGGTFSSTTGLSLNASSGTVDVSASTPGTYTITYTTTGACANTSNVSFEVLDLPVITFTAPASPYCPNINTDNLGGGLPTGGIYSGAGVTDNGNGTSFSFDSTNLSGDITITYTFINENTCTNSASDDINVVDLLSPQIVCPDDQQVNLDPNGTYALGDYIADGTATVTDNCTDPVMIFTQNPVPGTLLDLGVQEVTFTAEDESGSVSTCSFQLDVQQTLGANGQQDFASVVLYPNPADSIVFLSNPKQMDLSEVTIYDLTGKIVNVLDLTNMGLEISIDISALANAEYLLVIKGEQGTSTKSLIINNN